MGSVRIPSITAFFPGDAFTTFLAANIPRKKEITVATTPVFSEINSGLQSSSFKISIISSMYSLLKNAGSLFLSVRFSA